MTARRLRWIALAAFTCAAAPALAQNPPAPPGDQTPPETKPEAVDEDAQKARAKPFYIDAKRQHESGEYLAAAENYLAAYREYPQPAFIYNAAQVYRLGGKLDEALAHYKKYLELAPEGEGAKYAREFVASIEKKLAEPPPPDDTKTDDPETDDPGETPPADLTVGDASGEIRPEPLPVISKSAVAGEGQNKRLVGLAFAGAGVVLVGVGVGFGLHARSLSAEASDFMGPFDQLEDLYERGDAADRNMVIFLSAGAVTAAAGGLLYYLGARDRSRAERDLDFFASPARDGAIIGVALSR